MWQRLLVALLALAIIGGCSKPEVPVHTEPAPVEPAAPEPVQLPVPEPDPPPPKPPANTIPRGSMDRHYVDPVTVTAGTSEVRVDEEGFDVVFHLPPDTTREQVRSALSITAPVQPRVVFGAPHEYLEAFVRFPAGKPGEVIQVRLAGPVGPAGTQADIGFSITRHPSPRVTAELKQADDTWVPLVTVPVLPKQPLTLRFRPDGGASLAAVTEKIRIALQHHPHLIEEVGADALIVTVPTPPPLLNFEFREVPGEYGAILDGGVTIYTGEPPRLVSLDLVSGKEQVLLDVPPDLLRTSLSPDGRWLMLSGMAQGSPGQNQVWVVNLETREIYLTPLADEYLRHSPVIWFSDRLVLPMYGRVQLWRLQERRAEIRPSNAWWWESASPDGRYLIGYEVDWGRENKQWLAPASVFVHDVERGAERGLTDLVLYRVPHRGGYPAIGTNWEQGGRTALIHTYKWDETLQEALRSSVRLDVATGKSSPGAGSPPAPAPYQEWLPGPQGWQVRNNSGAWGQVVLRAPDGAEHDRGHGLVVGWTDPGRLLVVRWNTEERRYRYGE